VITEERKQELASGFSAAVERYLDKQWVDSETKDQIADNDEEKEWLIRCLSYSVTTHY